MLTLIIGFVLFRTSSLEAGPGSALSYPVPAIDIPAAAHHLGAALRFETISYDDTSNTQAFESFRAWLIDTYPRFHATTRRTVVGEGTLLHEWPGTDATLSPIVLMAHQDVVPVPQPERWRHPPFSGAVADGAIWGRGALDDKGSLIAILEAAESLIAAGHRPVRGVTFVFGHDEESGGKGARAAAELLASRGVRAAFVIDEGGVSLRDAPVTNAPLSLIGIAEKGTLTLQLEVRTAGGHSNAPGTRTAVDVLANAIVAIRANPFPASYAGVTRDMLDGMAPHAPFMTRMAIANSWVFESMLVRQLSATPQGAATLQTTIAPTMLQGSPKQNVLPSVATAAINFRVMPGESSDSVIAHVRRSLGDLPVTVTQVGALSEPTPVASTRSAGYRLISGLAVELFDAPVVPFLMIGVTDSRHMSPLTGDIYRFSPVQLQSKDVAGVHGFDERISIENFGRMLDFYSQLIVGGSAASLP
jgi:carboxypeptidase PM20D1